MFGLGGLFAVICTSPPQLKLDLLPGTNLRRSDPTSYPSSRTPSYMVMAFPREHNTVHLPLQSTCLTHYVPTRLLMTWHAPMSYSTTVLNLG